MKDISIMLCLFSIVFMIGSIILLIRKKLFDGTWYIWYVIIIDVLFISFLFLYKLG